MTDRYCPDCDKTLPESEFYVAGRHKDGTPVLRRVCKKHYNLRCAHPERARPIARKPQSRSVKSHRRAAFERILGGLR